MTGQRRLDDIDRQRPARPFAKAHAQRQQRWFTQPRQQCHMRGLGTNMTRHRMIQRTGLSLFQTLWYVVIPQAVRNVLPDLATNTLEVVKLTALASVVSFAELLYSADMARSVTYNASPITMAALLYLVMMLPLVRLVSRLEHRVGS